MSAYRYAERFNRAIVRVCDPGRRFWGIRQQFFTTRLIPVLEYIGGPGSAEERPSAATKLKRLLTLEEDPLRHLPDWHAPDFAASRSGDCDNAYMVSVSADGKSPLNQTVHVRDSERLEGEVWATAG
ncbi:hypothetical protein BLAT2472_11396 [Burkholderia latens]